MSLVATTTLGLERLGRECLVVLMSGMDAELERQQTDWAGLDEDLAGFREVDYVPITLEQIAPQDFHLGHRPSLINAPIERYPNISTMAYRSTESPFNTLDHIDSSMLTLMVEAMVKAEPQDQSGNVEIELEAQDLCNRRIQRLTDGIVTCLLQNKTLNGMVPEIGTPRVVITDVFTRRDKTSHGQKWFWQGSRVEFPIQKESPRPSSDSGSFFRVPQEDFGIDQG